MPVTSSSLVRRDRFVGIAGRHHSLSDLLQNRDVAAQFNVHARGAVIMVVKVGIRDTATCRVVTVVTRSRNGTHSRHPGLVSLEGVHTPLQSDASHVVTRPVRTGSRR